MLCSRSKQIHHNNNNNNNSKVNKYTKILDFESELETRAKRERRDLYQGSKIPLMDLETLPGTESNEIER